MARYGISQEGLSSLRQLANDMNSLMDHIEESGQKLKSSVRGLGEGLGVYEEKIEELTEEVRREQGPGKEAVTQLVGDINRMIQKIESLIGSGLG